MSKTKEYSSDVQQRIVELRKIESGCKKIAKKFKKTIYHIGQWQIKKFQSTKDVRNQPGRRHMSILY